MGLAKRSSNCNNKSFGEIIMDCTMTRSLTKSSYMNNLRKSSIGASTGGKQSVQGRRGPKKF